ncbi:MAG: glycosyltransferase [Lutibacter sp.]|uniref:glycosyltransferase n=1 Tax=Lutibacter sp. TaxID=1925666 RepID=UPI0019E335B5|nr:glycosyltransferase [Lutibacter sp.]NOR28395.1 glycosyltransferase [Lutibacter sp.]
MKLLQINTIVNSGSTGRITEDIGSVAIENGHESFIGYGRGNQSSKSKLIKIGTTKDIYIHGLKTLLLDKHGLGSKKATKYFIAQIEECKPDVIGLQNIHGYYLNYQVLFDYLKKHQLPVIWTFHDCWPFTGHCSYFEMVACEKWITHCEKCPQKSSYPKSFNDRSFNNYRDKKIAFVGLKNLHIITPSYWLKEKVEQSFLKDYTVEVIHNGVDLNRFRFLNKELPKTNIILGVASIWDKRKGLADFIKLRESISNKFQIVLIGLNDSQIKKLPKGIVGIQRTESIEELVAWYNKAMVFVNPTYTDNFPTTNIEALACGTPVITYNTGGSPEAIDGSTGIVVEKGNVQKLKNAIEEVSKKGKENYSYLCRERAEKLFNKDKRFQEYINLYTKLLVSSKEG